MYLNRKFILLIFLSLFIVSCDKGCIESNNLGEEGEIDQFVVNASKNQCAWNEAENMLASGQSSLIFNCLNTTTPNDIALDSGLAEVFLEDGTYNLASYCSNFDYIDANFNVENFKFNEDKNSYEKKDYVKKVFDECLNYCYTDCCYYAGCSTNSYRAQVNGWAKNTLKSNNEFFGISIDKDSKIRVSVDGKIQLSGLNIETKKIFNDNFYVKSDLKNLNNSEMIGDLLIDLREQNTTLQGTLSDLRRYYLEVKAPNINLIPIRNENNYNLQRPFYSSISAFYNNNSENNTILADNLVKYSDVFSSSDFCPLNSNDCSNYGDIINNLNNIYNLNNLKINVFDNDFYNYSSNVFNFITYDDVDKEYKISATTNEEKILNIPYTIEEYSMGGNVLGYEIRNDQGNVEGYVWDNNSYDYTMAEYKTTEKSGSNYINKVEYFENDRNQVGTSKTEYLPTGSEGVGKTNYYLFSFDINKASKIAIKFLKDNNLSCNYKILELPYVSTNNYPIVNDLNLTSNLNWKVLKNKEGKKEIILNQFSTIKNPLDRKIYIMTSNESCKNGVAIKLLPLKEYEVQESGYAFFGIPSYNGASYDINYSVINPDALKNENYSGATQDKIAKKIKNFFELSDNSADSNNVQYVFNEIKVLNGVEEIRNLDKNPNSVKEKGIYVRKGQLLRFDHNNWLNLNEKSKINIKEWGYSYTNENGEVIPFNIPFGFNLMVFTKEKPAFYCREVLGKENIDVNQICSYLDLTSSSGKGIGETSESGKCEALFIEDVVKNIGLNSPCDFTKVFNSNAKDIYRVADGEVVDFENYWLRYLKDIKVASGFKNSDNAKTFKNPNNALADFKSKIGGCINNLTTNGFKFYTENENKKNEEFEPILNGIEGCSGAEACINFINDNIMKTKIEEVHYGDENKTTYNVKAGLKLFKNIEDYLVLELPQCYNLDNFKGSFNYFNTAIGEEEKSEGEVENITNNGFLNDELIKLGATKVKKFSAVNDGKISYRGTLDLATREKDNSGVYRYMISNFSLPSNNYFSAMFLKDSIYNKSSNYNINSQELILSISGSQILTTGKQLGVFLGLNDVNYSDSVEALEAEKSSKPFNWIVKYKKNDDGFILDTDNTNYTFINGKLTFKDGSQFVQSDLIEKFLEENPNKNPVLYFKIFDLDAIDDNNNGYYTIKMTNTAAGNDFLSSIFETLIGSVLFLMDGNSFGIAKTPDGSTYAGCSSTNGNDLCYIFDNDSPRITGNICKQEEENPNCFSSCKILSTNEEYSTRCEYIYNNGGFLKVLYQYTISDTLYQFIVKLALITMLVMYGFGYFLGLTNFSQSELMGRLFKVALIYTCISETGWSFYYKYVVSFFKQGVDSILFIIASSFDVSSSGTIEDALQKGDFTNKSILFSAGFQNLRIIFSEAVFNKILGLAFSSWYGLIYLYLVLTSVITYCVGFINSIIMYLTAQVFLSITLAIGPLIFIFLFFEKTKKSFDSWLGILIGFSIQQIFIIINLSFFNNLIYNIIKYVFSYPVCWGNILSVNILGSPLSLISFWKIPTGSNSNAAVNLQSAAENGPGFYNIMLFYFVGILMSKFVASMAALGNELGGGIGINKFSDKLTQAVTGAGNTAKSMVKKVAKSPMDMTQKRIQGFTKKHHDDLKSQNVKRATFNAQRQSDAEKAWESKTESDPNFAKNNDKKNFIRNFKNQMNDSNYQNATNNYGDEIKNYAKEHGKDFDAMEDQDKRNITKEFLKSKDLMAK